MSARQQTFQDIQVGETAVIEQVITEQMVARFAELSGDFSPIHMNQEAAIARGFQGRVVHGFLSGSLVSQVLGMLRSIRNGLTPFGLLVSNPALTRLFTLGVSGLAPRK